MPFALPTAGTTSAQVAARRWPCEGSPKAVWWKCGRRSIDSASSIRALRATPQIVRRAARRHSQRFQGFHPRSWRAAQSRVFGGWCCWNIDFVDSDSHRIGGNAIPDRTARWWTVQRGARAQTSGSRHRRARTRRGLLPWHVGTRRLNVRVLRASQNADCSLRGLVDVHDSSLLQEE
jgi:hypothetical protein